VSQYRTVALPAYDHMPQEAAVEFPAGLNEASFYLFLSYGAVLYYQPTRFPRPKRGKPTCVSRLEEETAHKVHRWVALLRYTVCLGIPFDNPQTNETGNHHARASLSRKSKRRGASAKQNEIDCLKTGGNRPPILAISRNATDAKRARTLRSALLI
jgi:hypothetical protein